MYRSAPLLFCIQTPSSRTSFVVSSHIVTDTFLPPLPVKYHVLSILFGQDVSRRLCDGSCLSLHHGGSRSYGRSTSLWHYSHCLPEWHVSSSLSFWTPGILTNPRQHGHPVPHHHGHAFLSATFCPHGLRRTGHSLPHSCRRGLSITIILDLTFLVAPDFQSPSLRNSYSMSLQTHTHLSLIHI